MDNTRARKRLLLSKNTHTNGKRKISVGVCESAENVALVCMLVCAPMCDRRLLVRRGKSLKLAVIFCIGRIPSRAPRACCRPHDNRWLLGFGRRHRQECTPRRCGPCLPGLQTQNCELRIDLNTLKSFLQASRFGLLRKDFVLKDPHVLLRAEEGVRVRS